MGAAGRTQGWEVEVGGLTLAPPSVGPYTRALGRSLPGFKTRLSRDL